MKYLLLVICFASPFTSIAQCCCGSLILQFEDSKGKVISDQGNRYSFDIKAENSTASYHWSTQIAAAAQEKHLYIDTGCGLNQISIKIKDRDTSERMEIQFNHLPGDITLRIKPIQFLDTSYSLNWEDLLME